MHAEYYLAQGPKKDHTPQSINKITTKRKLKNFSFAFASQVFSPVLLQTASRQDVG